MSKEKEIDTRDSVSMGGVVSAWILLYVWAAFFLWHFLPDPRNEWWGLPAVLTTILGVFSPLAIAAWVDQYFEFTEKKP